MDDTIKRALLGDILDRVGPDGIGQLVIEQNNTINVGQEQPMHMPPYLTRERALEIYDFLIKGSYIEQTTPSEDFLYLIGVASTPPVKMKPINWLGTVQQLRVLLKLTFEEPINRGSLKMAEIERRTPFCFLIKGKKMTELAKAREEISKELSNIEDFFRPK